MDLRRPSICLDCAYTACFFHDPVRDAASPHDGAEVGTSHVGLHLAEEAHGFGTLLCLC